MTVSIAAVLSEVDKIEAAVVVGDLGVADDAVKALRPLLIGHCAEDLLELRHRMQKLSLQVTQIRDGDASDLKKISKSRGRAQAYQNIQREI